MHSDITLKKKKPNEGPELEMVKRFLKNIDIFLEEGLEYTVFTETITEVGIPDILIVLWDKELISNWTKERNQLNKIDLKIIHHIASFGKRGLYLSQVEELGYSIKQLRLSLRKLADSGLLEVCGDKLSCTRLDEAFFIKKIIAVEAKMNNVTSALNQAKLNENFSSHSYVLLPDEKVNKRIKSKFDSKIGLISQSDNKTTMKKKALKSKLPGSYFSWIINEYIGRMHYNLLSYE